MEKHLIDKVSQFTLEQIYDELYNIKRDLDWLDDSISLTKSQREIYNDINTRVKKLLGCR
jgi:hypothetical protein